MPNAVLDVVRTRDENGEDGASALLTLAIKHLGKTFERPNPEEISGNTEDAKGFEGRPEEYPPEQLNVLLEEMEKSQTFDAYSYLPKWFEYWERAGRGSDLLKVVAAALKADEIRERNLQYVLDAAFALCVKLKGPAAAFDLAVKAQIELGGWSEFFMESREDSQTRLRLVAKYYPERADEFIAKSAKTWLRHKRQPSPVVIPGEKLVFFLVQLNRIDEAERLVQEMATALLQETRNLPLTRPQWAANS